MIVQATRSRHWESNDWTFFSFAFQVHLQQKNQNSFSLSHRKKPEVANKYTRIFNSKCAKCKMIFFLKCACRLYSLLNSFPVCLAFIPGLALYFMENCRFFIAFGIDIWFLMKNFPFDLRTKAMCSWLVRWELMADHYEFSTGSVALKCIQLVDDDACSHRQACIKLNHIITGTIELNFNLALNWDIFLAARAAPMLQLNIMNKVGTQKSPGWHEFIWTRYPDGTHTYIKSLFVLSKKQEARVEQYAFKLDHCMSLCGNHTINNMPCIADDSRLAKELKLSFAW